MQTSVEVSPNEAAPGVEVFRIVLLARVANVIDWFVSEVVLCHKGSSRQVLRLIKRFHRVEGIIKRAAANDIPSIVPRSPYAATLGARLTLNGRVLEQIAPFGEQPTLADLEKLKSKPPPPEPKAAAAKARATVPRARYSSKGKADRA